MITYHNGPKRTEFATVEGRIIMVADGTVLQGFTQPAKVISDDGRFVVVHPLKRSWSPERRAHLTTDLTDPDYEKKVDKRSIKVSCDSASEVEAVLEVARQLDKEFLLFLKRCESTHLRLEGVEIADESSVVYDRGMDGWFNPDTNTLITKGNSK